MPDPFSIDPDATAPTAVPDGVPHVYTNALVIRGGAFDVTLDLGFAIQPASPDQVSEPASWLARVTMSWEHATALSHYLAVAIKQYEDSVGHLPDVEKLRIGGKP